MYDEFTVYLIINACLKTLTDLKNTEVESVLACKEKEFMIEVFIQIKDPPQIVQCNSDEYVSFLKG